jgi:hypothetical protein
MEKKTTIYDLFFAAFLETGKHFIPAVQLKPWGISNLKLASSEVPGAVSLRIAVPEGSLVINCLYPESWRSFSIPDCQNTLSAGLLAFSLEEEEVPYRRISLINSAVHYFSLWNFCIWVVLDAEPDKVTQDRLQEYLRIFLSFFRPALGINCD